MGKQQPALASADALAAKETQACVTYPQAMYWSWALTAGHDPS